MAKRFIDTQIFDDDWFMSLSKDGKLFWIYVITKCDHAGILRLNTKLIEFQTGLKSLETVIKELDKSLVRVSKDLIFCPKFLSFQYPNFPKSQVRQQNSAIEILKKLNLWDEELNTYLTLSKELPNSYVNVNVNVNEDVNNNNKELIITLFDKFWNLYDYKVEKEKTLKLWQKLSFDECNKIISVVPKYVASTPDKKYRKHPTTYLNGKCWNDEIEISVKEETELKFGSPVSCHNGNYQVLRMRDGTLYIPSDASPDSKYGFKRKMTMDKGLVWVLEDVK